MATSSVPVKTQLGADELRGRSRTLSQRHRTVLLLVDGRRSLSEVIGLAQQAGAQASHFEDLLRMGMVASPEAGGVSPADETEPSGFDRSADPSEGSGFAVSAAAAVVPPAPRMAQFARPAAAQPAPQAAEPRRAAVPEQRPGPAAREPQPPPARLPQERAVPQAIPAAPANTRAVPAPAARGAPWPAPMPAAAPAPAPASASASVPVSAQARAPAPAPAPARAPAAAAPQRAPNPAHVRPLSAAPAEAQAPTLSIRSEVLGMEAPKVGSGRVANELETKKVDRVRALLTETLRIDSPVYGARMLVRLSEAVTTDDLIELVWAIERHLVGARHSRQEMISLQRAREALGLGNTVVPDE